MQTILRNSSKKSAFHPYFLTQYRIFRPFGGQFCFL